MIEMKEKDPTASGTLSKDGFAIMLDGVVHGPFRRVLIKPMLTSNNQVARVPFMSFLPQNV